jgi:tyrosine-protein kinase Etk/Wzc
MHMNVETSRAVTDTTDEPEVDLLGLLEVVFSRIRLLVVGPLIVGLVTAIFLFISDPIFTAKTVVMLPGGSQSSAASLLQSLGSVGGAVGASVGLKNPSDQIVSIVKSRTLADRVIARFSLKEVYEVDLMQDARLAFEGAMRAGAGKDGLISIEVDDTSPKRAMEIANAVPQELTRLLGELARSEAQQRRQFFEQQLVDTKEQLTKAETALKAGGIDGDSFKSNPQAAVTAVAQLQAQIAAQEVRLGAMRGYMTETAPDYKQAAVELGALRSQLTKLEGTQIAKGGPAGQSDYVQRFRNYKYYETLFDLISRQYEVARLNESQGGTVIQVLDLAVEPERKSKPKRVIVAAVAMLMTGFLLLLYVFVAHGLSSFRAKPENDARLRAMWANFKGKRS